jgi:hypothetical protein
VTLTRSKHLIFEHDFRAVDEALLRDLIDEALRELRCPDRERSWSLPGIVRAIKSYPDKGSVELDGVVVVAWEKAPAPYWKFTGRVDVTVATEEPMP